MVKNLLTNAGDAIDSGWIPGPGISPGVGNGKPLQYSCLENYTNRRVWRATVYGVAKESNMTYRLNNNNSKHMESSQTRDQTHVP